MTTCKPRKKLISFKAESYIAGYSFIALPIIGLLLFTFVPLGFSLYVTVNEYDFFTNEYTFVGFANFRKAFNDPLFINGLQNTGLTLLGLGVQIVVSLMIALLLTVEIKGQSIFRAFFFVPSLCSSVAVTLVWKWMFNADFGVLNSFLGIFGISKVNWLGNPKIAMFSMILQGIWMGIGGGMVMYIAALKNSPKQLYEAAEIDGANSIQKFFRITLPIISPTTFYILTTSVIGAMTDFTRFKMMTDGGPYYSTLTSALYIYQTAFTATYDYNYSYATTMSWILGSITIIIVAILFETSKRWVHYND